MSRYGIDPPDDDAYDVRYDGTDCADCGRPSVAWLCETCSDRRESWAAAVELRMAAGVVAVQIIPVGTIYTGPVVEVALVPIQTGVNPQPADARFLKRMAKAILSADLSNVKDVA